MRDDMVGGGVMSTFAESLSSGVLTCQKCSRCHRVVRACADAITA